MFACWGSAPIVTGLSPAVKEASGRDPESWHVMACVHSSPGSLFCDFEQVTTSSLHFLIYKIGMVFLIATVLSQ